VLRFLAVFQSDNRAAADAPAHLGGGGPPSLGAASRPKSARYDEHFLSPPARCLCSDRADTSPTRSCPFNRAGYVTADSQPGEPADAGSVQRAYVSGYCNKEIAETLQLRAWRQTLCALSAAPEPPKGPTCP
jgi:hypothetical protein